MEIKIINLTLTEINEQFLKELSQEILKKEEKEKEISIVIVGPKRMKFLNRKHYGKNKIEERLFLRNNEGGEIFLCPRRIKKIAKRCGEDFQKRLAFIFVDTLLDLLGVKEKEEYFKKFLEK